MVWRNCSPHLLAGSHLAPLHGSAGAVIDGELFLFGGERLDTFETTNEMYRIKKKGSTHWDVTEVQQDGEVPCGRLGHTFTALWDKYILLHGGASMDLRDSHFLVQTRFRQTGNDPYFYLFDISTNFWSKIRLPGLCCRAYHTAVFNESQDSIIILGGVHYNEGAQAIHRIDIRDVTCLKIDTTGTASSPKFSLQVFSLDLPTPVYISNHACVFSKSDKKLYVFGGIQQQDSAIPTDAHSVQYEGAATMFVVDTDVWDCKTVHAGYAQSDFRTRGHSMFQLAPDCIMIIGGVQKTIFMYTTKLMVPDPCGLQEQCRISESDVVSPIPWIQCEFCGQWLHQFCVKLVRVPRGKYKCPECIDNAGETKGKGREKKKK